MNTAEYRIGAGSLAIEGVDVGGTTPEGMLMKFEPNIHQHMSGKYGMTPVKATLIGQLITLEVTMAETTKANMAKVFAGVTEKNGKIRFGGVAGLEVVGKELTFVPFDGTHTWVFKNAVPTSPIEVAYQVENERVYKVTFTAMVDTAETEAENLVYVS